MDPSAVAVVEDLLDLGLGFSLMCLSMLLGT